MGRGLFQFLGEILGRLVVVRLQHPQIPVANRARQFEHSQDGSHARDTLVPAVVKMRGGIGDGAIAGFQRGLPEFCRSR